MCLFSQILNTITDEILEAVGSYKSPLDQVEFIKSQFETKGLETVLIRIYIFFQYN